MQRFVIPAQARRFLAALAPGETRFTFQTFDDKKERKDRALARILQGTLDEHLPELTDLNAHGAGVFVMIQEGDGKGRANANVQRIRAVFLDLDGAPFPRRSTIPLAPHLGVATSPGRYHLYWRVDGVPLDAFKPIQAFLARRYGGDEGITDLARVMRLPGFMHRKNAPYLVRVLGAR